MKQRSSIDIVLLIQLIIIFSYQDWLILVSPVMHLNDLGHTSYISDLFLYSYEWAHIIS